MFLLLLSNCRRKKKEIWVKNFSSTKIYSASLSLSSSVRKVSQGRNMRIFHFLSLSHYRIQNRTYLSLTRFFATLLSCFSLKGPTFKMFSPSHSLFRIFLVSSLFNFVQPPLSPIYLPGGIFPFPRFAFHVVFTKKIKAPSVHFSCLCVEPRMVSLWSSNFLCVQKSPSAFSILKTSFNMLHDFIDFVLSFSTSSL